VDEVDLGALRVDADHLVALLGKAAGGNGADVAQAHDADLHDVFLSRDRAWGWPRMDAPIDPPWASRREGHSPIGSPRPCAARSPRRCARARRGWGRA